MVKFLAEWFNDGGPFMWAILAVLAFSCTVVADRIIFFYIVCGRKGNQLLSQVAGLLNSDKSREAGELLSRGRAPLQVLFRTALERFNSGLPIDEIREGVEEAAIQQVPRLSQRLNYLSLFANIATLLGLLVLLPVYSCRSLHLQQLMPQKRLRFWPPVSPRR